MANGLKITEKQNKAAEEFVLNGGNRSAAYRHAYDAENMSPESVWVEACTVFKVPNVAVRVLELQEEGRERHLVTVESIARELTEARDLAMDIDQPSAAVSASNGKAKLYGLITDKKEVGGPNGGPIVHDIEISFIGMDD